MRTIAGTATAVLLLSCIDAGMGHAQQAANEERDPSYRELVRQVANTTIVWIDSKYIENNSGIKDIVRDSARRFTDQVSILLYDKEGVIAPAAVYNDLHGFVLPVRPDVAKATLAKLAALQLISNPESAADKLENERRQGLIDLSGGLSATPDMIVSLADADCTENDVMPLAAPVPNVPDGVQRVGGGGALTGYVPQVWIIDSGLYNGSKYINVVEDKAANCRDRNEDDEWSCATKTEDPHNLYSNTFVDKIGHGTMLAGIIAARPPVNSTFDFFGVAPNAPVVPIKIFNRNPDTNLSGAPLAALQYVASHADTGDIVNMSWGAAWLENMYRSNNQLETVMGSKTESGIIKSGWIDVLRTMSQKVKLVVAAGNIDPAIRPSLVSFVAPAALGSYPNAGAGTAGDNDGCDICTVSAVDSTDTFWWEPPLGANPDPQATGEHGSNYGRNPPDFAEPGVDIWSLWPSNDPGDPNRANKCSGTSFAAAHLSGVLARNTIKENGLLKVTDPAIDGHALNDPDVFDPDLPDPDSPQSPDPNLADPIGIAVPRPAP